MELEQNTFLLHRVLLTRIPKIAFYLAIIVFSAMTIHALFAMSYRSPLYNLTECFQEYFMKTRKDPQNNTTKIDTNLIDQFSLINLYLSQNSTKQCQIRYNQLYEKEGNHGFMHLASNQQLVFLNSEKQFAEKHSIVYDSITIPKYQIARKWFNIYFDEQITANEYLIQTLDASLFNLQMKFIARPPFQNQTLNSLIYQKTLLYFHESTEYTFTDTIFLSLFIDFTHSKQALIWKVTFFFLTFITLMIISGFVGLLVRWTLILFLTIYLFFSQFFVEDQWGWIHQYMRIIRGRSRQQLVSSIKFSIFFVLAIFGTYLLFANGLRQIINLLVSPMLFLSGRYYRAPFLKNMVAIELFFYLFARSRVNIRYFPIISYCITSIVLLYAWINPFNNTLQIINLHLLLHFILFSVSLLIQKLILEEGQQGFIGNYTPSLAKPRMLFYAGYDISWQKSVPPIWTYFTRWYDYSFFDQKQKSLIQKDYQLLYGRMLGMNERQELPEDSQADEEERHRMRSEQQASNQIRLIQNDH